MKKKKYNRINGTIVLAVVFLVAVFTVLGFVLTKMSSNTLISLIRDRMLDITNTAADMLDGDTLASLTKDDSESPAYHHVLEILTYFQDNIELEYIYCINDDGDGTFSFSVDPSPVDPGEFGEDIAYTFALYKASKGEASVDDTPYVDAWGRFYSAYSPVFKSDGTIGGIVAVDFSADWYDAQVRRLVTTIVALGLISLAVGVLLVIVITHKVRKRYRVLNGQLNELAVKVEELLKEIESGSSPGSSAPAAEALDEEFFRGEDADALGEKILSMQDEIRDHLELIRAQAYRDGLTGVGNKTAYLDTVKRIDQAIADRTAAFAVAVFDVNGLKNINDHYGHECGDLSLVEISGQLKKVFGVDSMFRIGGDEFIAVLDRGTAETVIPLFAELDRSIEEFNRTGRQYEFELAVSKGMAVYDPALGEDYKAVFRRADLAMYEDKKNYYLTHGDRRRY